MNKVLGLVALLSSVFQVACFAGSRAQLNQATPEAERITYLQKQLSERDAQIQTLREQNLLLREVQELPQKSLGKSSRSIPKTQHSKATVDAAVSLIEPILSLPQSESEYYQKIVETYQKGQVDKLKSLNESFLRAYPNSIHLDNSLYLLGLAKVEKGQLQPALKTMDELIDKYPRANKRPAALFAKAAIYRDLKLQSQSLFVLDSLIKSYPGSPEAKRAELEMRIIKDGKNEG